MKTGDYIRVEKIETLPEAKTEGLAIGYYVEGTLARELRTGQGMLLDRKVRNGIRKDGHFLTSPITAIVHGESHKTIYTHNSAYSLTIAVDLD